MIMAGTWFAGAVYLLCFLTSASCAWLLLRGWFAARGQLLLWSALCFLLLALNNLLVIVDLMVVPGIDLSLWRLVATLAGVSVLLFGFIWRGDEA
jgi:hypothetical protein